MATFREKPNDKQKLINFSFSFALSSFSGYIFISSVFHVLVDRQKLQFEVELDASFTSENIYSEVCSKRQIGLSNKIMVLLCNSKTLGVVSRAE